MSAEPVANLLMSLNQAWRNLMFYPSGHPGLQGAVERIGQTLPLAFDGVGVLELGCVRDGFLLKGQPLAQDHPQLKKLAGEFFQRRVKTLCLHSGTHGAELLDLMKMLLVSREDLARQGGAEAWLVEHRIDHVRVNEARFDHLAVQEHPPPPPSEDDDLLPTPVPAPPVADSEIEALRKELARLLFDLPGQTDDNGYQNVLGRVLHLCGTLRGKGEWIPTIQALQMLAAQHSDPKIGVRRLQLAADASQHLHGSGLLDHLMARAARMDESELEEVGRILQSLGPSAIEPVWARFDEAASRNAPELEGLTALIPWLGPDMKERIVQRLQDGRITRGLVDLMSRVGEIPDGNALRMPLLKGEPALRGAIRQLLVQKGDEESARLLAQGAQSAVLPEIGSFVSALGRIDVPAGRKALVGLAATAREAGADRGLELLQCILPVVAQRPHADWTALLARLGQEWPGQPRERARALAPRLAEALAAQRTDESLATLTALAEHEEESVREAAWKAWAGLAGWMDPAVGPESA